VSGFLPSKHGFPFPNSYPPGTPVVTVPTPFGKLRIGDAGLGVCGGMAYAAVDLFRSGRPVPPEPSPEVFGYLCRRLLDSFDFPFGFLRYYAWQMRPDASRFLSGVRVLNGVSRLTAVEEWPKVKAQLDAGSPAPLGLVKVRTYSLNPWHLGKNHQVLAYGYALQGETAEVFVYDPNYPCDDGVSLRFDLTAPDAGRPVVHSREGPSVRGFFRTEYRWPGRDPAFG
jgi:hypothetical protein